MARSQQAYADGSWEPLPAVGPKSLFLFPQASPRRLGLLVTRQLGDKNNCSRNPRWKPLTIKSRALETHSAAFCWSADTNALTQGEED